jgi:hypothetical protein
MPYREPPRAIADNEAGHIKRQLLKSNGLCNVIFKRSLLFRTSKSRNERLERLMNAKDDDTDTKEGLQEEVPPMKV